MAQATCLLDLVALGLRLYSMILTTGADKLAGHDSVRATTTMTPGTF